jgi:aminopeptidase N
MVRPPELNRRLSRLVPQAILCALLLLGLDPIVSSTGHSNDSLEHMCRYCSRALPSASVDSPNYRKYAPDRKVDILHLALDITPDFKSRTITGSSTLKFKPIGTALEEFRLDIADLSIKQVKSARGGLSHQVTDTEIILNFNPPIPPGQESTVTVEYSAEPTKGLYFRTKEMGYAATHLWTQGEPIESRHWFPCFDHPVEKFTSEVTCHLPKGMVALSNGQQQPSTTDNNGMTSFRWIQSKPHVNYLITLVAGEFEKIQDLHRNVPLQFWTTPNEISKAPNSFRHTKSMMEFFERELGVPYPWEKYGQVAVHDYHWGGMENTSLTTLNHRTLFDSQTENLFSSDSLVAHELAHQWFGDLVTCKDWSHIWLNEGFATFYDWLWQGSFFGENELLYALYQAAKGILSNTNETRGIVWRKFTEPNEMFNYLAYPKGAWVLNMLRQQLGPDMYRKCITAYLRKHQYGSVTSDDLRSVIESVSGRNLDRFFEQWVNGIGAPAIDAAYSWDEKTQTAKITVKQTQKISEEAPLFQFPLNVRFVSKSGRIDKTVHIHQKEETFYFPLKTAPESVRVDPSLGVLAKITFKPGRPMLFQQLADNSDIVAQLRALDELAEKPDQETVSKIQAVLQSAEHYGVRIRAAEVLKQARTSDSLEALGNCLNQPDARVRNAVVSALGGFFEPKAQQQLTKIVASEKNPGVIATALRALGPYQNPEVQQLLTDALAQPSYRDRILEGALAGIRTQDDSRFAQAITAVAQQRIAGLPGPLVTAALETLGFISRHEQNRDSVRETLTGLLTSERETVRLAAISGLGFLEDARAAGILETFANASPAKPEKNAAMKALEKIRAARKGSEELKGLRDEIAELKKTEAELKKDFENFRKKIESK